MHKKDVMVNGTLKKELVPCKELKLSATQVHYKKLMAYLLLLYRSYLQGEITLEPEIQMAFWRMIQLHKEFALKVRMAQSEYLSKTDIDLNSDWDKVKETLFPKEGLAINEKGDSKHENLIKEYKEAVLELIQMP